MAKLKGLVGTGVETNSNGQSMDFTIGDVGVAISILRSKLYSKPIQTLVQEYLCNARDAARELQTAKTGTEKPILISIPTDRSKVFKVRDFGPGISPDRMADVFVKYCNSTKRNSNAQTGGFGIGAKSAFAYTDNFTVVSYVDGTARHYVAHLGKNNQGSLDLIDTKKTTEPNGTEIQIAVSGDDLEEFERAIYRATFFWKVRPVFKNREETDLPAWYVAPQPLAESDSASVYASDDLPAVFSGDDDAEGGYLLVIDGIPYIASGAMRELKQSAKLLESLASGVVIAHHLNTGDLEIAASREALTDTKDNFRVVEKASAHALDAVKKCMKRDFTKAKTLQDFIKAYRSVKSYAQITSKHSFKDSDGTTYEIASNGHLSSASFKTIGIFRVELAETRGGNSRITIDPDQRVSIDISDDRHFFHADEETSKVVQSEKLKKAMSHIETSEQGGYYGRRRRNAVLLQNPNDFTDESVASLAKKFGATPLSSIEVERKSRVRKSDPGVVIHAFKGEGKGMYTRVCDLERNKTLHIYDEKAADAEKSRVQIERIREVADLIEAIGSGARICLLSATAIEKVKGRADFVHVSDFFKQIQSHLSQKEISALVTALSVCLSSDLRSDIEWLLRSSTFKKSLCRVKDRTLRSSLTELALLERSKGNSIRNTDFLICSIAEHFPVLKERVQLISETEKLISGKYPILKSVSVWGDRKANALVEEIIFYLNAKNEVA
jgi:hypothetical protein